MDPCPSRMSPMDIALGHLFGQVDHVLEPTRSRQSPRQALEHAVLRAVSRPPCGVLFSGGRDSSSVLAIATHVARRHGLPDPIPMTLLYPDAASTDERAWQELVVRHLGLSDWERREYTDEMDVVGPFATRQLRRHGLLWIPYSHTATPFLELLPDGSLLDGNGGDEVLGDEHHRIKPVARVMRLRRPLSLRLGLSVVRALAPRGLRVNRKRRRHAGDAAPWLREPARLAWIEAAADAEAQSWLSFERSVRHKVQSRAVAQWLETQRLLAEDAGTRWSSPLLDPDVVDALARHGGFLGPGSREESLRTLLGDLLPPGLPSRTSKAVFTEAYFTNHTRAFARGWDGTGLDGDLVDPEALRRAWLGDGVLGLTSALLQTAWLATHTTAG